MHLNQDSLVTVQEPLNNRMVATGITSNNTRLNMLILLT